MDSIDTLSEIGDLVIDSDAGNEGEGETHFH